MSGFEVLLLLILGTILLMFTPARLFVIGFFELIGAGLQVGVGCVTFIVASIALGAVALFVMAVLSVFF